MLELREGECQDLSLNGMFIHTAKPSPRGALIRFECDAGRPEDNFRGTGRVVWQRRKPDPRGPAGMGVRFVRLESGDHDALERIIRQLNENATTNPTTSASQRAPLDATLRGMPPGPATPGSDRPAGPASASARAPAPDEPGPAQRSGSGAAAPMPSSSRPPMPTLLEVPRNMPGPRAPLMATVPETGSNPPNAGAMGRTLLGQPAPSLHARAEARREDGRPEATDAGPHTGEGNAAVIESSLRPEPIPSARAAAREASGEAEAGRAGGRDSGKKRTRQDRQRGNDGSRNGRGDTRGGSARPHGRGDVALELSDPGPDFGARRRRLAYDDDGDGRVETDPPRKTPGTVMWLVLGTGLIVSWGLVTLFGTVPIGVPDKYEVPATKPVPGPGEPSATPPTPGEGSALANASGAPEPGASNAPPARRYALFVDTQPPGARISVAGQSVVAPARVEFDTIEPPLKLVAELANYKTTTVDVWPSDFTANGGRLEHRLALDLQPESPTAEPAVPAKDADGRTPPRATAAVVPKPRRPETPPEPVATGVTAAAGDAVTAGEPAPEPAPTAEPQAASSSGGSGQALAQALECLAHGDNRCVIRALESRANTARELELLIETYRAMSSTPKAESEMRRYLSIYPNGKRAAEYRRLLERRGAKL